MNYQYPHRHKFTRYKMAISWRDWLIVSLFLLPWPAGASQCSAGQQWYLPATARSISSDEWLTQTDSKSVILIGEHHDNADHHRWQQQVLQRLLQTYAPRRQVMVGFEMIPRSRQNVLSAWQTGSQSLDELRQRLPWEAGWGFDFAYYSPLLDLARRQAKRLLALNADDELVTRVRDSGWEQTPDALRQGLQAPAPPSRDYLRILAGSFLAHAPPQGEEDAAQRKQRFLRFVQGQQVWDSVMAQSIAQALHTAPDALVIAFMGSWHMIAGGGVAHQLRQLGVKDLAILVPWDSHLDCDLISDGFADAVYGLDYRRTGKLPRQSPPDARAPEADTVDREKTTP